MRSPELEYVCSVCEEEYSPKDIIVLDFECGCCRMEICVSCRKDLDFSALEEEGDFVEGEYTPTPWL
jgi:hypothetical protein